MAGDGSTMTFLAFPLEIRRLIYMHLSTNEKTYCITSANAPSAVTIGEDDAEPNLGIINTCRTTQHEMLETLCPHNTIRFLFPSPDTSVRSLYHQLAARMTRIELYVYLGPFPLDRFEAGHHDRQIHRISDQVSEALRTWSSQPMKGKSCRIIIKDDTRSVSPLLQLQMFEAVKTLVGLETVLIVVLLFKPDLSRLGAFLGPSLGPSSVYFDWPPLHNVEWGYGSILFHPRKFGAGGTGEDEVACIEGSHSMAARFHMCG